MCTKRILFLSGEDFKEKSIQVIRKTPEAYRDRGWGVHYIVYRDISNNSNNYSEDPVYIPDIDIQRYILPGWKLDNRITNKLLYSLVFRMRRVICIFLLFSKGWTFLRDRSVDVVYGYEPAGFVAARLLKIFGKTGSAKIVSRFQGVLHIKEWLRKGEKYRYITNFDYIYALKAPSDLCIMTNDGSQGETVLKQLHSQQANVRFWPNGVDNFCISDDEILSFKSQNHFYDIPTTKFVSISRLDDHKRLDRGIKIIENLIRQQQYTNLHYIIVGDGKLRSNFEALVKSKKLEQYIIFVGAVNYEKIKMYLYLSDFFISMYTSTNVGNPLMEAIRLNKLIVTLSNGDTGFWIQHKINGLIYPVDDDVDLGINDYTLIASNIYQLIHSPKCQSNLIHGIKQTAKTRLWTWKERFDAEVKEVENLISCL
jgi:glycosyltransferase involved in cell wall biosynthesis